MPIRPHQFAARGPASSLDMCDADLAWARDAPETLRLAGPLSGVLDHLWGTITARRIHPMLRDRHLAGLKIVDADTLAAPTPGMEQLARDAEDELFQEVAGRLECRVCPETLTARRSDAGAAAGQGWVCAWFIEEVSAVDEIAWETAMDHLFVATTLDRPDGTPALYHLADADARTQFGRLLPPCPPPHTDLRDLLGDEG